jgi:Polysaccharide deacetylase
LLAELNPESHGTRPSLYLLYHEIRSSRSDYSYVLETAQFNKQMEFFVQMREASNCPLWPQVTFDDGHISNYTCALPVLQSQGLQARFFITVGWTGQRPGYMGWEELRALHQAGQSIGAHGWTHTLLTHCSEAELQRELLDARLTLEDKLGTSVATMSLPGGRYNPRVLAACRQAGYTQVYTSIPKTEPDPTAFTVGRLNIRGDMTLDWIASLFQPGGSVLSSLERQYRIKATAKSLLGDRLYEKVWALLNRKETDTDVEEAAAHEDPAHHQ